LGRRRLFASRWAAMSCETTILPFAVNPFEGP
jgi:hypothetical protein